MSHTTKTTNVTYLNTSRENMLEWKRAFDTTCDKHPERLLSVVTNNKLHSSILLKYMTQYKQLKMTFEGDHDARWAVLTVDRLRTRIFRESLVI